jgi:hypothetical protein
MVTLVYKMTHVGDPHPRLGCWGVYNCMGKIRCYEFDAVIGIGGRSWRKNQTNRAGEIIWIGRGAHRTRGSDKHSPEVRFERFRYFEDGAKKLGEVAPQLAEAMRNRRFMIHEFGEEEKIEIEKILRLAARAKTSASLRTQIIKKQINGEECHQGISRRGPCGRPT